MLGEEMWRGHMEEMVTSNNNNCHGWPACYYLMKPGFFLFIVYRRVNCTESIWILVSVTWLIRTLTKGRLMGSRADFI